MSDLLLIIPTFVVLVLAVLLVRRVRQANDRLVRLLAICGFSFSALIAILLTLSLGYRFWYFHRPQPAATRQILFEGVTYIRDVRTDPRPMVIHVLLIDLSAPGIGFLVTPGQPVEEYDIPARTTGQFLQEFGVQLAINGGGFHPWRSVMLWDYYPHVGDGVTIEGFASSKGTVYSTSHREFPTLYLAADNKASFDKPIGAVYNAISALFYIVKDGKWVQPRRDYYRNYGGLNPRTVLALDKDAHTLILIVVDGRQPNYSEGATLEEMAAIAIQYGADVAVNQDGGGSSVMVMQGASNVPVLLSSPIDSYIPGRERALGNHLGIFARPVKAN